LAASFIYISRFTVGHNALGGSGYSVRYFRRLIALPPFKPRTDGISSPALRIKIAISTRWRGALAADTCRRRPFEHPAEQLDSRESESPACP